MRTAIVTVGLGFGDEGKGATTDFLCRYYGADLVVRYSGGSQCGHNVTLPDGRSHCFAQFGSGTLAGVKTYIGPDVIITPEFIIQEAKALEANGVAEPFRTLEVDANCVVATAYHRELNRALELQRGDNRHGSCGHGIGEARRHARDHTIDAIRAGDLRDRKMLIAKLDKIRWDLGKRVACIFSGDPETRAKIEAFAFGSTPGQEADELIVHGSPLQVRRGVPDYEFAVFEGAQGVLLDENHGYAQPYTTWSTVTSENALKIASQTGAERVFTLGITRSFLTRHGAGPLPGELSTIPAAFHDSRNPSNPWQGRMRIAPLDFDLLRQSVEATGGVDAIAVTWADLRNVFGPIYHEIDGIAPLKLVSYGPTWEDRDVLGELFPGIRSRETAHANA